MQEGVGPGSPDLNSALALPRRAGVGRPLTQRRERGEAPDPAAPLTQPRERGEAPDPATPPRPPLQEGSAVAVALALCSRLPCSHS